MTDEFLSTDPKHYKVERTSACHGKDNPNGFGWVVTYDDGKVKKEMTLPDNIVAMFVKNKLLVNTNDRD